MYQINNAAPHLDSEPESLSALLQKALTNINSFSIKVSDIDDPDAFLHNRQILMETQKFLSEQIAKLK